MGTNMKAERKHWQWVVKPKLAGNLQTHYFAGSPVKPWCLTIRDRVSPHFQGFFHL